MARTLINVPAKAKRGQVIEIKTLISHVMETGYRRNEVGAVVPRDIINAFVCTYNGEEVFRADLYPAIAANPFITLLRDGDRKRQVRVQLDRRRGQRRNRVGRDHGRMSAAVAGARSLRRPRARCMTRPTHRRHRRADPATPMTRHGRAT